MALGWNYQFWSIFYQNRGIWPPICHSLFNWPTLYHCVLLWWTTSVLDIFILVRLSTGNCDILFEYLFIRNPNYFDITSNSLLILGVLSQVLLFFFWDSQINGKSVPFFILFFAASVVDCTSSVSFIPFMTKLQTRFLQRNRLENFRFFAFFFNFQPDKVISWARAYQDLFPLLLV